MKKLSALLLIPLLFTMTACSQKTSDDADQPADKPEETAAFDQLADPEKGEEIAVITTNKGVIKLRLFEEKAPETVKSFKALAEIKKYDGVIFHRVIKDFMIQGGDFENRNGTGGYSYKGPGTTLPDEVDPELKHLQGAVSMANKGSGTQTGGSQFFIVHPAEGVDYLDGGYAIFGQVLEGQEVVDEIAEVETAVGDKPLEDVIMEKVEIMEY